MAARPPKGLVAALALLVAVVVFAALVAEHLPLAALGARLQGSGVGGLLVFLAAGVLATAVGLPRQGLAFVAGLAWGVPLGLVTSLVAAIGGCALTVALSTRFLRAYVLARYPRPVATLARLVEHDAFAKIVALRLQPLGTNLLTNLTVGLTPMPRATFLAASLVGYVPQMLVFALLGAGVRVGSSAQLATSAALLLVSLAIGALLYRRHVGRVPTD